MKNKPAIAKPKPLFSRSEIIGLCKRFLKPDEYAQKYYDPKVSPITMYQLVKAYPDRAFWTNYSLGFQLRSLFWLTGKDGQEKLANDYAIFKLDLGPVREEKIGAQKVGEDVVIVKKPKTMAELFR